jgi:glutathione synthase/RimK-type ligase-like ATP-grasp enzyme
MTVAVLYEHPEWFRPLFATLDRRGVDYVEIDAAALAWRPADRPAFDLLVNRMSPSAYLRGHGHAIHAALHYVAYVESWGIPVVNGSAAYGLEISKAAQLRLLDRLGLRYPASRVINDAGRAIEACEGLRFPIVVKPNIGGSGARIQRFDSREALARAVDAGTVDLGIDHTALVQEFLPARGGSITRVELLDAELLYAIRITPPSGFGFNLCPADICRDGDEQATPAGTAVQGLCATKPAMDIVATDVPAAVADAARTIARTAGLDVCGIEFLIDDRDGHPYFYDINALSNFVTDAPRIVGFDPFEQFVAYVETRASGRGGVGRPSDVPADREPTAEAIFAS